MLRAAVLLALLAALARPALAQPAVVADTAPVHSLVAQVMAGVGEPQLLLPPGAPPHDASLRPSEARALGGADVIVWTGPAFLPWMEGALASLAPDARAVELLATPGWEPLPARPADNGGGSGGLDPHAWLDPAVAAAWTGAIAEALAAADPANADAYRANAAAAAERLRAEGYALRARLAPLRGRGFAASHDVLQYFERASGLPSLGSAAATDAGAAPAGRVLALRDAAERGELRCFLVEPNADPALGASLAEGTGLRVAAIDPEGLAIPPGPGLYGALLGGIADALESCLR